MQFYLEALILGILGGILGILFGITIIAIIAPLTFDTILPQIIKVIKIKDMVIALLSALLISLIFGILPFYVTFKKNITETLRNE